MLFLLTDFPQKLKLEKVHGALIILFYVSPNFKTERRLQNLYKRENFKPEIKLMIENLQDELYQLENKQAKGAKLAANIR